MTHARNSSPGGGFASFIPKSGKQTFGLGHFFNGCTSRAERGLEISTLAVVDVTRRCALTLAVAQTPPGEKAPKAEPDDTRVDFYDGDYEASASLAAEHHLSLRGRLLCEEIY